MTQYLDYNINTKEVIEQATGRKFKKAGSSYVMSSPFRSDDDTPSFSLSISKNCWKDFGGTESGKGAISFIMRYMGYDFNQACAYLGIKIEEYERKQNDNKLIREFFDNRIAECDSYFGFNLVDIYPYTNRYNEVQYYKVKFKLPKGKKQFRYVHLVGEGKDRKVVDGRGDRQELPYNMYHMQQAIDKSRPVVIVEGEKDCHTVIQLGNTAISLKEVTQLDVDFKDSKIYFIGDTGEAGEGYKEHCWELVKDKCQSFNVVTLPGLSQLGDNKDITDWVEDGHTVEEYQKAKKEAWDWKKSKLWPIVKPKGKGEDIKWEPEICWSNLEQLLLRENIRVRYNVVSREVEIDTPLKELGINAQLEDLHQLSLRNGFRPTDNKLVNMVDRIAQNNSYSPVCDYLTKCQDNFNGKMVYIDELIDTLTLSEETELYVKVRKIAVTKWLLGLARIAFSSNFDKRNVEGLLVLMGPQGTYKTSWTRSIIPNKDWIKTGVVLNPSDKDSIINSTAYWLVEIGEMDATMKYDQARLKGFITEQTDFYRAPYARKPEKHPRRTGFVATVNKSEFLKDETGNRRYWTVPVKVANPNHGIDLDQLWGEVMYRLNVLKEPHYLTPEELLLTEEVNNRFRNMSEVEMKVQDKFDWSVPECDWVQQTSSEIVEKLNLKTNNGLKDALLKHKVKEPGRGKGSYRGQRVYWVPPYRGCNDIEWD